MVSIKGEMAIYEFRFVGDMAPCYKDCSEGLEIYDAEEAETGSLVTALMDPVIGPVLQHEIF